MPDAPPPAPLPETPATLLPFEEQAPAARSGSAYAHAHEGEIRDTHGKPARKGIGRRVNIASSKELSADSAYRRATRASNYSMYSRGGEDPSGYDEDGASEPP